VSRLDLRINGETSAGYWTEPDFVIAFALSLLVAAVFNQYLLKIPAEIGQ
jgi:hypothetical protein